jgi:hypothetical protein
MKGRFKIESAEIHEVGDSKIYSVTFRGIDEERREVGARVTYIWAAESVPMGTFKYPTQAFDHRRRTIHHARLVPH